jgi:hypothetical protein
MRARMIGSCSVLGLAPNRTADACRSQNGPPRNTKHRPRKVLHLHAIRCRCPGILWGNEKESVVDLRDMQKATFGSLAGVTDRDGSGAL